MSGLKLRFMVPSEDLRPFVTLFYHFDCPADVDDLERAAVAQLRFRLTPKPAHYEFVDGTRQSVTPIHVIGPTMGAKRTYAVGPVRVFGMGLSPVGWSALLSRDASPLVNRCIDATVAIGPDVVEPVRALTEARSEEEMLAIIEPWLRRRIAGYHDGAIDFVQAVDAWLASCPSPSMDALIDRTGLSRRHVERRCNALYGAPPKLLARKYRALRAAVAMASGEDSDWEGFYDQSHMIREVKHFTGLTPKKMREKPGWLAAITINRRRALQGQVPRLYTNS